MHLVCLVVHLVETSKAQQLGFDLEGALWCMIPPLSPAFSVSLLSNKEEMPQKKKGFIFSDEYRFGVRKGSATFLMACATLIKKKI